MQGYHPSKAPDPEVWLKIDESTRIEMVLENHMAAQVEFEEGADNVHAVIHVIVENQNALNVEPVPSTIAKLVRQGLSRHESIHAVGAVLSEDIFNLMKSAGSDFSMKKYRRRLEKLTAKRWNKGQL
jgi:hypothetical protein